MTDNVYECSKCKTTFPQEKYLKRHLNKNIPCNKIHKCERCGKVFGTMQILRKHKNRKNPCIPENQENNDEQIICENCNKEYSSQSALNRHIREKACVALKHDGNDPSIKQRLDLIEEVVSMQKQMAISMEQLYKKVHYLETELIPRIKIIERNQKALNSRMKELEQHTGINRRVYFIFQEGDDTKCKIGKSKNPDERVKQLQTGNPNPLYIHKTLRGYTELETKIHADQAEKRIDKTEWFLISKEEVDEIIMTYE